MSDSLLFDSFVQSEKTVFELFAQIPLEAFITLFEKQITARTVKGIIDEYGEYEMNLPLHTLTFKALFDLLSTYSEVRALFKKGGFGNKLVKKALGSNWLREEVQKNFFDNLGACENLIGFYLEILVTPLEYRVIDNQIWSELNNDILDELIPRVPYYSNSEDIDAFYDYFAGFLSFSHGSALRAACSLYSIKFEDLDYIREYDYEKFCAIHKYAGELYSATPSATGCLTGVSDGLDLFKYHEEVLKIKKRSSRGICPFTPYVKNYLRAMGIFLQKNKVTILSAIEEGYKNVYNIEA